MGSAASGEAKSASRAIAEIRIRMTASSVLKSSIVGDLLTSKGPNESKQRNPFANSNLPE
jgi:hypothetical protein